MHLVAESLTLSLCRGYLFVSSYSLQKTNKTFLATDFEKNIIHKILYTKNCRIDTIVNAPNKTYGQLAKSVLHLVLKESP